MGRNFYKTYFALRLFTFFLNCASFRDLGRKALFLSLFGVVKKENKKYSENVIINGDSA